MNKIVTPYMTSADKLLSGERLTIKGCAIKTAKHLSFTCDISDLGDGKLLVGHGYEVSSASWIEIDANEVRAFAYYTYTDPKKRPLFKETTPHGIRIKDFVSVVIDVNPLERAAFLIIMSSGGMFKTQIDGWDGVDGDIFATVEGTSVANCKLNWFSDGFSRRIWVLGDSYLGIGHGARWPYYLFRDGYNHVMISGYPGMPSERGIEEFRRFVQKGTPEYAVWCYGMNNADTEDSVNAGYLAATEEFLAICCERGITPILSTIPNTPTRSNRLKNEWVRSLPHRYIDFARAVGSEKSSAWYEGMLSADQVHPDTRGAEALYMQVLVDFPEIMQRSNT